MLRVVELEGLERRRPRQLSGGQQQRVALARALVNRPAALLLDEPLGALDVKLRKQMQLELKRIQTELGTTFVYVTHDQDEALAMSDRIAVMNAAGSSRSARRARSTSSPATAFVADFIGSLNALEIAGEARSRPPGAGAHRSAGRRLAADRDRCRGRLSRDVHAVPRRHAELGTWSATASPTTPPWTRSPPARASPSRGSPSTRRF